MIIWKLMKHVKYFLMMIFRIIYWRFIFFLLVIIFHWIKYFSYVTFDNVNFRYLFISDFPMICIILKSRNFILKVYFLFILLMFLLSDKYKSQILYLSPFSNFLLLSISLLK